jgi:hypothetical protein
VGTAAALRAASTEKKPCEERSEEGTERRECDFYIALHVESALLTTLRMSVYYANAQLICNVSINCKSPVSSIEGITLTYQGGWNRQSY